MSHVVSLLVNMVWILWTHKLNKKPSGLSSTTVPEFTNKKVTVDTSSLCYLAPSFWVIFQLNCGVATIDIFCLVQLAVRFRGSVEVARFGMRESRDMHLISDVCSCHVLRILTVDVCKIWDVCCLPAPAHQPYSFNSLDLSAPEEAYSRKVCASGTL